MSKNEIEEWRIDEGIRIQQAFEKGEITRFERTRRLKEIASSHSITGEGK